MPGMPLGLLDGVDKRLLEGCYVDSQLIEPAQQLGRERSS
jgi:hypothetical protein